MSIEALNAMSVVQAEVWFNNTCTASRWCKLMASNRPYINSTQLEEAAISCWSKMKTDDLLEAFAGHPMIGDIDSLRAKYASTKAIAANEQSGMQQADDATFERLNDLNHQYVARHGFIFIICATGLTAGEMLSALQGRINNSTEQERIIAAKEQLKITLLRFEKALREPE